MIIDYWAKNGVVYVDMGGLSEIGRARTFENIWKYSKNDVKRLKIFENVQKSESFWVKIGGNEDAESF